MDINKVSRQHPHQFVSPLPLKPYFSQLQYLQATPADLQSANAAVVEREPTPDLIYPPRFLLGDLTLYQTDPGQSIMSSDVAATIFFGDLRDSYNKQHERVESLRMSVETLESQFLLSVRDRAMRSESSITKEEKNHHEELRRVLNRTRVQLGDEVKLLQWLRRRHNMAVISRKAHTRYMVF